MKNVKWMVVAALVLALAGITVSSLAGHPDRAVPYGLAAIVLAILSLHEK